MNRNYVRIEIMCVLILGNYTVYFRSFFLPFLRLVSYIRLCQSQWPLGLRRGYAAIRRVGMWVRIQSAQSF